MVYDDCSISDELLQYISVANKNSVEKIDSSRIDQGSGNP